MRQVKRLGKHHPDVATTLAATAGLLKAMGRTSDAETVYRLVRAEPNSGFTMAVRTMAFFKAVTRQHCTEQAGMWREQVARRLIAQQGLLYRLVAISQQRTCLPAYSGPEAVHISQAPRIQC